MPGIVCVITGTCWEHPSAPRGVAGDRWQGGTGVEAAKQH